MRRAAHYLFAAVALAAAAALLAWVVASAWRATRPAPEVLQGQVELPPQATELLSAPLAGVVQQVLVAPGERGFEPEPQCGIVGRVGQNQNVCAQAAVFGQQGHEAVCEVLFEGGGVCEGRVHVKAERGNRRDYSKP